MKLNRNTKKARYLVQGYERSCNYCLNQCYSSYSYSKHAAEVHCREKMLDMGGYGFKILSFNSQTFTCGWLYEDKQTGVIMLNVETYRNTYTIEY